MATTGFETLTNSDVGRRRETTDERENRQEFLHPIHACILTKTHHREQQNHDNTDHTRAAKL
jgi:hypothetical protein